MSSRNAPSHLKGGALRDDTKDGYVADYDYTGLYRIAFRPPRKFCDGAKMRHAD